MTNARQSPRDHTKEATAARATSVALALVALGALTVTSPEVEASVLVRASEARRYPLPEGFESGSFEIVQGAGGEALLVGGLDRRCTVIYVGRRGVRSYTLPAEERPARCAGAEPHPGGGFFVRAEELDLPDGAVGGFTTFVAPDGSRPWQVEDEVFVEAAPVSEGGAGDYRGTYAAPHRAMAYSPAVDRLLLFSVATLDIGAEQRRFAQGHVLDAESGALRVNGQLFGQSGASPVGNVRVRPDGLFTLFFRFPTGRGARFYEYDGRESIDAFEPLGRSWEERVVLRMRYGPDERLYLMWAETLDDTRTRISAATRQGDRVWEKEYPETTTLLDRELGLGRALGLWVGAEHALALYLPEGLPVVRVIDPDTGESLGTTLLQFPERDHIPQAIVVDAEGDLRLLAVDPATEEMVEHRLTVRDLPDVPGLGGEDEAEDLDGAPAEPDGGCGCRQMRRRAPLEAPALALASLCAAAALARRRALHKRAP